MMRGRQLACFTSSLVFTDHLCNLQAADELAQRLAKSKQHRENLQARVQGLEALVTAKDKVIVAKAHIADSGCKVRRWS